ncbi:MAG TPA: hypothetical protein VFE34_07140 [Dongiaceae bacterium]|jgi:hypothetical protein|nr:hypothetical protein [Dongiaceae bacterium]
MEPGRIEHACSGGVRRKADRRVQWSFDRVIDDLLRVDALLEGMQQMLPIRTTPTPELAAVIRQQRPGLDLQPEWQIAEVTYAGDPGGIMCRLRAGTDGGGGDFVVSITHLRFDRRVPMAREIVAYQKRRVERLRRLGADKMPLREDRRQ